MRSARDGLDPAATPLVSKHPLTGFPFLVRPASFNSCTTNANSRRFPESMGSSKKLKMIPDLKKSPSDATSKIPKNKLKIEHRLPQARRFSNPVLRSPTRCDQRAGLESYLNQFVLGRCNPGTKVTVPFINGLRVASSPERRGRVCRGVSQGHILHSLGLRSGTRQP